MISEWMRIMLEEIARKNAEAEQDEIEESRRREQQDEARPDERREPP